ncbi:hypothetical protein [Marininema halotolerans]|uniref:Uncharacterized protein n=1 Tax=Marininema halotolerans TaxID=1155944 RepID=A0A1I6Q566_9BACL|nr:hypothetical protein [Marininema halotolerans]SFS47498.1 hypothetical protein SAMN05444972_102350 [Marininema halotolerans]
MLLNLIHYLPFQLIVLGIALLLSWFIDKRPHAGHDEKVPPGFESTNEVTIDPVTNEKRRVYYHPETGERYYRVEKE